MGYEILGARTLFPIYGNSIYVWGAIISVFLAGLSIGYAAGGRLADRQSDILTLSRIILIPTILIVLFPYYGPSLCKRFEVLSLDPRLGSLLISAILFIMPCVFMGSVIPVIVKMLATDNSRIGSAAGNVYSISTAGSIAGTLFTSFFLISWLPVHKGIQLTGLILASCWFLCLTYHQMNKKQDGA
ncbi:MAG TPA: hypothetical protein DET40_14695 [Lentisphaeria bacterium]|nr:MAG: hypothetical protein A2X45_05865 [Lentisphaerae bacterium GWF2_50_93]HCE44786.1 hypothetical protein [Lentisphaeria bacterium]